MIVDSLEVSWIAISKIVELYGKESDTLEQFRWNFKLPYWDYLVEKGFALEAAKDRKIPELYIKFYRELKHKVFLFPDVKDAINQLWNNSISLAVVSQAPRDLLREMLTQYSLIDYFDVRLGLGDYKEPKPSPESINIALKELQKSPEESLMVGDMREDLIAARRAGVLPVANYRENGSCHPRLYLEEENPAYIIGDLRELVDIVKDRILQLA